MKNRILCGGSYDTPIKDCAVYSTITLDESVGAAPCGFRLVKSFLNHVEDEYNSIEICGAGVSTDHGILYVDDFYINKYPIRLFIYDLFCKETNRPPIHRERNRSIWSPVSGVSALDAEAYIDWWNAEFDDNLRLPTYNEWLLAAQSNNGFKYNWGDDPIVDMINCRESGIGMPVSVKNYPANSNLIYGMLGSVWEWTSTVIE